MVQQIFKDIKMVDMTKFLSGPIATRYFADLGAEVIKIEQKDNPDATRVLPPIKNGKSGYFEMLNRNKKSITLDLKNEQQLKLFYKLIKETDVFVENMTPSVKKRLKIDYEDLRNHNKNIIYASLCGIDQSTDRKYFDVIAQADSGLMSLSGTPEEPMKIGPAVVDAYSGANLAFAISSALYNKEKTGQGMQLSVSMLSSAMNLLEHNITEFSITKQDPKRVGNMDNVIAPFGIFNTKEGKIVLAVATEGHWELFVNEFDKDNRLYNDKFRDNNNRLENISELKIAIEKIFSEQNNKDLINKLHSLGIPAAKINEMSDIINNEWFYKSGSLITYDHPDLGKIVVPGSAISINNDTKINYSQAPDQGQDNSKYDIKD